MERKFYTDNFEQLLKEKSDEFRMYPSKRVWHSIYNDLHPGRKWPSIAASMLLIIGLLLIGYWNNNNNSPVLTSQKSTSTTATQAGIPNSAIDAINEAQQQINSLQQQNSTLKTVRYIVVGINNSKRSVPLEQLGNLNKTKADIVTEETNPLAEIDATAAPNTTIVNSNLKEVGLDLLIKSNNGELITSSEDIVKLLEPGNSKLSSTVTIAGTSTSKEEELPLKVNSAATKNIGISTEEKAWIEDYAFHNKSKRKKWQDRTTLEFYITPNIGYRKLSNDSKYNLSSSSPSFVTITGGGDANRSVDQNPGLGLEAGVSIGYSIAKNLRLKAGLQADYTNYGVNADETNHPILTTLMLVDPISGTSYMQPSSSTLANTSGSQPVKVHNKTYQVSLPVGLAIKLSGNKKMEWYAGATIQPTLMIGGKAFLISADRKNYVSAPSLIRKWNLNSGFETYINYKFDGFTLQAGPQFRYQLFSTYQKKYTVNENLYNVGIKIGVVKNF